MAVESGIAPSVLENESPAYLDAMVAHLQRRAEAMSDEEPSVDWDENPEGVTNAFS